MSETETTWLAVMLLDPLEEELETRLLLDTLAALPARRWDIAVPQLINEDANISKTHSGDRDVVSRGLALRISDATSGSVEQSHDLAQYEDAVTLLAAAARLSLRVGPFVVELGGAHVGELRDGVANRLLSEGLLDPWRNAVGSDLTTK